MSSVTAGWSSGSLRRKRDQMAVRVVAAFSILVAALVLNCEVSGQRFELRLTHPSYSPLPVTLTDQTGLVTAVAQEPDAQVANEPSLAAVAGDPNAAVLTWLGGACDSDATVLFHHLNGGYVMNVAIHEKIGLGCTAVGIPRSLRITT